MDLIPVLMVRWVLSEQGFLEPLHSTSAYALSDVVINVLWGRKK